jgi:hypothetical protein
MASSLGMVLIEDAPAAVGGEALSGLAEEADGQVEAMEVGLMTGMNVLDEAADDLLVGLVGLGPQADEEALTPVRLAGHRKSPFGDRIDYR